MADAASIPQETPKRKRSVETTIAPIVFSFNPNCPVKDSSNSPRSKVAHKFRGLALDSQDASGGGVVNSDDDSDGDDADVDGRSDDNSSDHLRRKRQKPDKDITDASKVEPDEMAKFDKKTPPLPEVVEKAGPTKKVSEGSIQRAYPSINRLSESKSRTRKKRAGTPPPRLRKKTPEASEAAGEDDEMEIVDPVRAALTWREDEITIYDPNDADDDGTGINGVGFRPTPALAHTWLMKRR